MRTTRRSFIGGALLAPLGSRIWAEGEKPLFVKPGRILVERLGK